MENLINIKTLIVALIANILLLSFSNKSMAHINDNYEGSWISAEAEIEYDGHGVFKICDRGNVTFENYDNKKSEFGFLQSKNKMFIIDEYFVKGWGVDEFTNETVGAGMII